MLYRPAQRLREHRWPKVHDLTSSDDFLFGLWMPGRAGGAGPARYLPKGTIDIYQTATPDSWLDWGNSDLSMGDKNGLGGSYAYCNQGNTYAGSPNEICGGESNWGATEGGVLRGPVQHLLERWQRRLLLRPDRLG